jgi:hypothetical protein
VSEDLEIGYFVLILTFEPSLNGKIKLFPFLYFGSKYSASRPAAIFSRIRLGLFPAISHFIMIIFED